MGSTYVDFQGQGFKARDATLEISLLFLVDEIDRLENLPQWLNEVRQEGRRRLHLPSARSLTLSLPPASDTRCTDARPSLSQSRSAPIVANLQFSHSAR
jgi:hypothetical protein